MRHWYEPPPTSRADAYRLAADALEAQGWKDKQSGTWVGLGIPTVGPCGMAADWLRAEADRLDAEGES